MKLNQKIFYYDKNGKSVPALVFQSKHNPDGIEVFDLTDMKIKTVDISQINDSEEQQYLNLLTELVNGIGIEGSNVAEKSDRTGTGTLSIFGHQMRFNLQKGFPLLTTKKVHFKSIVHELLWFLKGDTNTKYLEDNGVTIWREWKRPYSLQRDITFVETKPYRDYINYNGNYSRDGINATRGSLEDKLAGIWSKMMNRCYDSTSHNYKFYGGKGVFVCKEWHNPSTFISDVQKLPHWEYKLKDWNKFELDKDYYNSNVYSFESCVWLRTDENNLYTTACNPLLIIDNKGNKNIYLSLNQASEDLSIATTTLYRLVNNQNKNKTLKRNNKRFEDWIFQKLDVQNKLPRLKLIPNGDLGDIYGKQWRNFGGIDQITELVKSLKENPNSRRHLVSAWNVGELDQMALPPCHTLWQCYVANGKLSLQLYQRSADTFLGLPFNIASYALLTHLLAKACDLEVGDLIITLGDAHLYTNHIEQAYKQLERVPTPFPTLSIKEKKSIFDYTFEDIELLDYNPQPAIKAPVAI